MSSCALDSVANLQGDRVAVSSLTPAGKQLSVVRKLKNRR